MLKPFWRLLVFAMLVAVCPSFAISADVTIVEGGQARAAVFVPARLLDDRVKNPEPPGIARTWKAEDQRRRLRESIYDLVAIIERISGAKLAIIAGPPTADERRAPIIVGELATGLLGEPAKHRTGQGLRIVAKDGRLFLTGESDLATSYAIYTLLDQLGCRWYMPSEMGEVLPRLTTITIPAQDLSAAPASLHRAIWYCDNDYARRNRAGGPGLAAGHALENTVPKALRETHPEIRAQIAGKPHPHLVKWTHPLVAKAVADSILAGLAKEPLTPSFSLSPDDGAVWDESDDTKYDAGDFDPAIQAVSKTDRLMVFANRVAEQVAPQHPNVKLGILAYADYTRPPVREKLHPSIVPQIAPITFSRAQPMSDDREPNNAAIRKMVTGWGQAAPATSYYFYGFYLAEVSSPNPMIRKWGHDIPFIYAQGNCQYWQPETMSNFETSMHALYLGLRMAWDPQQQPGAIIDELHSKFYGAASKPMAEYWDHIDRTWVETPEFAGCGFGHLRRWTPEKLAAGRKSLDAAKSAAGTDLERQRVQLADDSFALFEQFMQLRRNLAEGRWQSLATDASRYVDRAKELGEKYQPQFAFARMGWTGERTVNVRYFEAFYKKTYDDAARVMNDAVRVGEPLRRWRYQPDERKQGEAVGWSRGEFDDSAWKTTDCAIDTWSAIGLHNYMGSVWYRTSVKLDPPAAGKRCHLWLGATDGRAKVFVNGQHIPWKNDKGETVDSFTGFCQPASFDITAALKPGENQISLFCTREFINELGTGGLIAPVAIYTDR